MNNTKKAFKDPVIKDFRNTPAAKSIRILSVIAFFVYIVFLVYFLFLVPGGLYMWEYIMLLCFAALPVLFSLIANVFPYTEYDKFRKKLSSEKYRAFLQEYIQSKKASYSHSGIITNDRIVFFMASIALPPLRDIVWIYDTPMPGAGAGNIVFLTRKKRFFIAVVKTSDTQNALNKYIYAIKEHNPDLMIGDTEENDKEYREKYEKKKKNKKGA